MTGANAAFLADLYARWVEKPDSVDASFAELFAALNDDAKSILTRCLRRLLGAPPARRLRARGPEAPPAPKGGTKPGRQGRARPGSRRRRPGRHPRRPARQHPRADADPQLPRPRPPRSPARPARPAAAEVAPGVGTRRPTASPRPTGTGRSSSTACWVWIPPGIRQIMAVCRASYCGPIGVEFMHIQDPDQKFWIQSRMEGAPWATAFDRAVKREILEHLTEAEGFEAFCAKKSSRPSASGSRAARPPSPRSRR